jgi:hypothetical protein
MVDPIHVAIGSEPDQRIPALVLEHSILKHASQPIEIHWSWDPHTREWNPMAAAYPRLAGTNFSSWRWLAPRVVRGWAACQGDGEGSPPPRRAIYMDCDQVALADLAELRDALPDGKTIGVVTGAVGKFGDKVPDPDARETSVMVFDPALATWDYDALARMVLDGTMLKWIREHVPGAREAKSAYAALMQATWLPAEIVAQIDTAWNHMNHVDERTKIVHFTHVRSQPWKAPGHALATWWGDQLAACVVSGHVTVSDVEEAVSADHLDAYWLSVARKAKA